MELTKRDLEIIVRSLEFDNSIREYLTDNNERVTLLNKCRKELKSDLLHNVSHCVKCGEREGGGKTNQCDTCLMDGIV